MTMICDRRSPVQTPGDVYCRVISGQGCTTAEYLDHIEYALRRGLGYRQPATADEYLAGRLRYPDRIRRWPRHAVEWCDIECEAREVEDRLDDADADPLPYRLRRRIIATLRVDPEWRAALRAVLIGEGV